ncbi:hypothetical protein N4T20_03685 [Flavobacterium sp. TR2]|uniref:hypothetical protein n=1 Tax=Flavobacterium sp. TR2 TaxID=2977321 RepID=UPI0021B0E03F|nr:hypothetical protein [Flavobacterium sp. TR2]UWY29030.1 hypothetical protein N4T20_03685 [Flavobacterium sp. TR2]
MKFKNLFLLLTLAVNFSFAQNNTIVTRDYGSSNKDIQALIEFEKIYMEQLNFEGENLKGKVYTINLQEFIDGKLANKSKLFDGFGEKSDHFTIKSTKESVRFLFKLADGKLKTYIICREAKSKKSYFDLKDDSENYVMKDFFGKETELNINANQETPILAIITPTRYADGFSSYCDVVQSDVKPENLGTHFNIPHYFLVTIQFK